MSGPILFRLLGSPTKENSSPGFTFPLKNTRVPLLDRTVMRAGTLPEYSRFRNVTCPSHSQSSSLPPCALTGCVSNNSVNTTVKWIAHLRPGGTIGVHPLPLVGT